MKTCRRSAKNMPTPPEKLATHIEMGSLAWRLRYQQGGLPP
jgi:hypothetical protein